MTFKELKKEAKKMGYSLYTDYNGIEYIRYEDIVFCSTGSFYLDFGIEGRAVISYDRTPDQMLMIMKALQ